MVVLQKTKMKPVVRKKVIFHRHFGSSLNIVRVHGLNSIFAINKVTSANMWKSQANDYRMIIKPKSPL